MAGSYVWDLKDNGYRKSYGIVTAMFGVAIMGCIAFRMLLNNLNKKLEQAEHDANARAEVDNADETLRIGKGFRYLV